MEPIDGGLEKATVADVDSVLRRLMKTWTATKKARREWDFKTASQTLETFGNLLVETTEKWAADQQTLKDVLQTEQNFVLSAEYVPAVETALKEAGIPLNGEFPTYEFPPFKLSFATEAGYIRLSIGRRSQQTKAFAPDQVAAWVAAQYQRVINSKFDSDRFCRELLGAYELLNRIQTQQSEVMWGTPIPLRDIYKLLTLKQSAKQDYPEALFIFDLARLKEQIDIRHDGRAFELSPSRKSGSSFLLVNSQGQESRVSDLIIHDREQ